MEIPTPSEMEEIYQERVKRQHKRFLMEQREEILGRLKALWAPGKVVQCWYYDPPSPEALELVLDEFRKKGWEFRYDSVFLYARAKGTRGWFWEVWK